MINHITLLSEWRDPSRHTTSGEKIDHVIQLQGNIIDDATQLQSDRIDHITQLQISIVGKVRNSPIVQY